MLFILTFSNKKLVDETGVQSDQKKLTDHTLDKGSASGTVTHVSPSKLYSIDVHSQSDALEESVQDSRNSDTSTTIEASSSEVYYSGVYWNDFEEVRSYMNKLSTGDPSLHWHEHLLSWNGGKPFRKALIVSCGNGFVERDLYSKGIILSAVGIDINQDLLRAARAEASKHNIPLTYYRIDSNKQDDFPDDSYDLVLNHAALHHVAYVDFHIRALSRVLRRTPGGILVNYDYVGPHRNQYDADTWDTMLKIDKDSDACFRKPNFERRYPHLPTMLLTDPSEAIHSELLLTTLDRYFEPVWLRFLNGALAYELLTHNENLQAECHSGAQLQDHIKKVIELDENFSQTHRGRELFMYSILKPRASLPSETDLHTWTNEENIREATALQNGGIYYPLTLAHIRSHGPSQAYNMQHTSSSAF